MDKASLTSRVLSAFEYAYPLWVMALTRHRALSCLRGDGCLATNTVQHVDQLSDHTSQWITAPNNDTLYSNAWLDLSRGPVRIRVDAMPPGRYWSVALMDEFTNHIAVLGQRLHGTGPVDVILVGPGHADAGLGAGGQGPLHLMAPGHDVWLFGRWLVEGPDDLEASRAMQRGLHVQAMADAQREPRPAPIAPSMPMRPANFLDVVNGALARNPPPALDHALLAQWHALGFRPGIQGAWSQLDDVTQQAWTDHWDLAFERVRAFGQQGRRRVQGWVASAKDIGNFGSNHALRASVAMGGLGALEPVEAMYFVKYQDEALQPLDGQRRYTLHVPASGIPTDSFWSFTMYEATLDGQRRLVANPLNRYAIGNRTAGLVKHGDASIDLVLQHESPREAQALANWLPTPAGPFQIALRAYGPHAALREGLALMPTVVERVGRV